MSIHKIKLIITVSALFTGLSFSSTASASIINKTPTDNSLTGLKNGLVGHWTFDGKDVTATQVLDKSGKGTVGVKGGAVTPVIGRMGQAFKFGGTAGSQVVAAHDADYNSQAITLSAWIKTLGSSGTVISKDGVSGNREFSLIINSGKAEVYFFQSAAVWSTAGNVVVNDDKWHHVVSSIDIAGDAKARVYIDGVLSHTSDTGIASIAATTRDVYIGEREAAFSYPLTGAIDDVRVYNRALSAVEIQQLYKMGAPSKVTQTPASKKLGINSGLVGYWTFDGKDWNSTGVTTTDKSGNGNDAGINNGVSKAAGKLGQGVQTDGTSGYMRVGDKDSLSFGNGSVDTPFSFSAWVKFTTSTLSPFCDILSKYGGDGHGYEYRFIILDTGLLSFNTYDNSAAAYKGRQYSVPLSANKWLHLVGTYNGNSAESGFAIYQNGIRVDDTSYSGGSYVAMENGTASFEIGREQESVYCKGSIDDVRLYNRALSAADIQQLYKMGVPSKVNKSNANKNLTGINRGLMGYWNFDGKNISGSSVLDSSGNGYTGTMYGGITKVKGKIGQALKLNGVNGTYIDLGVAAANTIRGGNFSVSLWVKYNSAGNAYTGIISTDQSSPYNFSIRKKSIGSNVVFMWLSTNNLDTGFAPSLDVWYHYLATFNTVSGRKFYINGSLVAQDSLTTAATQNSDSLYIGTDYTPSSDRNFDGTVDDVRMYNRTLSAAEVYQLYMMGR